MAREDHSFVTRCSSRAVQVEALIRSAFTRKAGTWRARQLYFSRTARKPLSDRSTSRRRLQFLGVSPSLVYAYVERKQIPHFRMMGRSIRFRLSELDRWRQQFHVNGGING